MSGKSYQALSRYSLYFYTLLLIKSKLGHNIFQETFAIYQPLILDQWPTYCSHKTISFPHHTTSLYFLNFKSISKLWYLSTFT